MIRVDVRASESPYIDDTREMPAIHQNMVYLVASFAIWVPPGVLLDILACKVGAADGHPPGSGEGSPYKQSKAESVPMAVYVYSKLRPTELV